MIKTLDKILDRPVSFQIDFLSNCTIAEKIDAYYITVKVKTPTTLQFYKRNMKHVTNVDCILNKMYTLLMNDWYDLMLRHKDVFENNVGKIIKFFYIPSEKPISTTYKIKQKYILDVDSSDFVFDDDILAKTKTYKASKILKTNVKEYINSDAFDITKVFDDLYDTGKMSLFAKNPEGFILRYNKGNIYQQVFNIHKSESNSSHFYYEYVLKDFINYYQKNINEVDDLLDSVYVTSVCKIFNNYIENWFKNGDLIESLSVDSLEPPFVGEKPEFNLDIIPNIKTKLICQENQLYEQIFKILLVNLKNKKTVNRCYFLSEDDVDFWNKTVTLILSLVNVEI